MEFIGKIAKGLTKTRDSMVRELKGVFGKGHLTAEVLQNIEERLLASDISFEIAEAILNEVKDKAHGQEIDIPRLLQWMAEATLHFLPEPSQEPLKTKPHVIMLVGVNGAGKTTTVAKLAHYHQSLGRKVLVAACDTF